jgi:lipoate-protein ligase A
MEIDTDLLSKLEATSSSPILHLYDWQVPSATYGHFIHPSDHLSEDVFNKNYLDLAKRPTGGGLILHTNDWAFSVLVPAAHEAFSVNTLDNYAFVNRLVIEVIAHFTGRSATLSLLQNEWETIDSSSRHFCMAKPTKYDVMLDGKKVCGGAQRRTRSGFLHQGTISLSLPDKDFLEKILPPNTRVSQDMFENTCPLLSGSSSAKNLVETKRELTEIFKTMI